MTLLQVVLPPLPPLPPSGPPEWIAPVIVVVVLTAAVLMFPVFRAFARRLDRHNLDDGVRGELEALHQRVAELEQVEARVADLENRIEFSERLLTRQREQLPEGTDHV